MRQRRVKWVVFDSILKFGVPIYLILLKIGMKLMKKSHFGIGLVISVTLGIFGTWPCTWSKTYQRVFL